MFYKLAQRNTHLTHLYLSLKLNSAMKDYVNTTARATTSYLFISMIKSKIAFYIIASGGGIYKYSQEFHFMEGYYYRFRKTCMNGLAICPLVYRSAGWEIT